MKEFNLILDKVSQALGITVDNVVKLYPQLRADEIYRELKLEEEINYGSL